MCHPLAGLWIDLFQMFDQSRESALVARITFQTAPACFKFFNLIVYLMGFAPKVPLFECLSRFSHCAWRIITFEHFHYLPMITALIDEIFDIALIKAGAFKDIANEYEKWLGRIQIVPNGARRAFPLSLQPSYC